MKMKRSGRENLWIVIPAYNEEKNIVGLLAAINEEEKPVPLIGGIKLLK